MMRDSGSVKLYCAVSVGVAAFDEALSWGVASASPDQKGFREDVR